MSKTPWIVLKIDISPNELICERCKEKQVMPEGPIRVSIFLAIGKEFTKIHKNCKEKN